MQLYGPGAGRDSRVAYEAGRQCMACWLVAQWESENDPRAKREDRYKLAAAIAEAKGKRISVPASVPVIDDNPPIKSLGAMRTNPIMAELSSDDLMAELKRRGIEVAND